MPLTPPPLDDNGKVIPHDHEGIYPSDGIIRRISNEFVVEDAKLGGLRLSSMAFKPSSEPNGGMSVDLQKQIEEVGHIAKNFVTTPRWIGSIRFEAGQLRVEEFKVGFDPIDSNPFHGEVWGTYPMVKQRRLMQLCEWFVPIPNVSIGK